MEKIPALDYIRIVGIDGSLEEEPSVSDITFNIEHSEDSDFNSSNRGIITLRFSELIDTSDMNRTEIEQIAKTLIHQILVREKDEDGRVVIAHFLGMPLDEWLLNNTPFLKQ